MDKPKKEPHLQLVHSAADQKGQPFQDLTNLNDCEFNWGSLDEALKHKAELYEQVSVPGAQTIDETIRLAKLSILKVLEQNGAFLYINTTRRKNIERQIAALHFNAKPQEGLNDFSYLLHTQSERVMTRAQLEEALAETNIRITDEDATRLLVYEINEGYMTPRILGLTNQRHPYNPLYVRTQVTTPLPAEMNALFRCWSY